MPDWKTESTSKKEGTTANNDGLAFQVLLVVCLTVYVVTAIWLLLRSYCLAYSSLASGATDPAIANVSPQDSMERRLDCLERVAPTKPFKIWWLSIQTIRSPLKQSDHIFTCSICLDKVRKKDPIHTLQCHHVFHRECLENWFLGFHNQCPMCKKPFFEELDMSPECAV
ncbi:hypothetical protein F9C07_11964 [Aspergillus flavus]|uniref:RING-type domain-containing protein n=3 Tax=Aspergillus subgen. Circumdati TaxID=2720871 RepID=A0A7U2N2S9_ASPFN|nr:unnamed protein product [Aspergillus oryzae RIB40]EIT77899.1 RING finger protein [Aspergillus oryzae 3.042]KAF7623173.1 hypothetical protein AFLA_010478 [Aspergillus flavus NRRL3357]KDE79607.1 RING finger protein [Aspergillus oryzae 100-8]QRD94320.1 hypothetical protein F9C07_11964 [Aspergillus flavus]BAE63405.1 unnamed protein product [Aspergillus oryzae RIB40]|eukprot:EIT77899.1 RING finger protein [Aspergillus oryzae 3.042]